MRYKKEIAHVIDSYLYHIDDTVCGDVKRKIYVRVISQGGNIPSMWLWVFIIGLALLGLKIIVFPAFLAVVMFHSVLVWIAACEIFLISCFVLIRWINKRNVRRITERYLIEEQLQSSRCFECGYDLRGSTVEKCPECGARMRPWEATIDEDELQRLI